MKKRIVSVVLSICIIAAGIACFAGCDNGGVPLTGEVINVYNWGEYISDGSDGGMDVIEEFTKQTGIKVNYTLFNSNEEMYLKLKSGAADYDIVIPSDYMIDRMIKEDMLAKLDFSNIPNYQYIDDQFKGLAYDPANEYTVPYCWGTVGILYNTTMVDPEDVADQSWDLLWNEKYANDILMFDNPRDNFAIALLKLGYSINSENPDEWQEAYDLLAQQKDILQGYAQDQIVEKLSLGEAAIGAYYTGEVYTINTDNGNEDIAYYVPQEGSNFFVDAMCVLKDTKYKEACEKFINFMCDPEVALANVEYITYGSPNTGVYDIIDDEMKNNKGIFPDEEILSRCEMFTDLPDDIYNLQNELWIKLRT